MAGGPCGAGARGAPYGKGGGRRFWSLPKAPDPPPRPEALPAPVGAHAPRRVSPRLEPRCQTRDVVCLRLLLSQAVGVVLQQVCHVHVFEVRGREVQEVLEHQEVARHLRGQRQTSASSLTRSAPEGGP